MPDRPLTVNVQVTEYRLSCLPLDHRDAYHFSVTVEWRGGDRWAVCRFGECLDADGGWDYEPSTSDRSDEWLVGHRFDHDTAMVLAAEACQHLTVNVLTVQDVLAQIGGAR